jgi:hypothetical protein
VPLVDRSTVQTNGHGITHGQLPHRRLYDVVVGQGHGDHHPLCPEIYEGLRQSDVLSDLSGNTSLDTSLSGIWWSTRLDYNLLYNLV